MNNHNDDWVGSGAKWIRKAGSEAATNLYLEFARRFTYTGTAPLTLDITAISQYQVALNGVVIGRGPAPSDPAYYYFDRYDLKPELLSTGENLLTVLLFHDGRQTQTVQGFHYGDPGLLVKISAGDDVICVSDAEWRVRQSPVYSPLASLVSQWGTYKTTYHAEREDGWQAPIYDHNTWEKAVTFAEPTTPDFVRNLALLEILPLEVQAISPVAVVDAAHNRAHIGPAEIGQPIKIKPGDPFAKPSITLDFGTMMVGYPEIEMSGGPCVIEIWYGETLDLYRLDVIHLPEGGGLWRAFQRRAYRFMQISFIALEGPVTVQRVTHCQHWYAYNNGTLQATDERLNQIIDISKYTVRANSSYHYEDCPLREQALWIFDMRSMSLVNYYNFYNPELTAKCLRQMFALQGEDGAIVSLGPKQAKLLMVDFCLHLVATLREYYQHTGDADLVRELYPYVGKLHGFLDQFRDDDGLLDSDRAPEYNLFLDWSDKIQKQGKTLILNALYKRYLEDAALLAELAGDTAFFQDLAAQVGPLREKIHETFYWPEKGLYRDAWRHGQPLEIISQQANMAAIYAGITPDDQAEAILERVWDAYPQPFAPAYYLIIFEALARLGRYNMILETITSYWGAMLDRGATTWWEVFDPTTPDWSYPHPFLGNTPTYELDWIPISTCHGWSSVPAYSIVRHLLGVDLSRLHENIIAIHPTPVLAQAITYSLPIRDGNLKIAFHPDGTFDLLETPPGVHILHEGAKS